MNTTDSAVWVSRWAKLKWISWWNQISTKANEASPQPKRDELYVQNEKKKEKKKIPPGIYPGYSIILWLVASNSLCKENSSCQTGCRNLVGCFCFFIQRRATFAMRFEAGNENERRIPRKLRPLALLFTLFLQTNQRIFLCPFSFSLLFPYFKVRPLSLSLALADSFAR